jgi:hypothetical protein
MWISKRLLITALAAALVGGLVSTATGKSGHDHGNRTLLKASVVGSLPTDPTFHAVLPGGAPWDGVGRVDVRRKGRLELRIRGLVIPGTGTGPVTTVSASLFCGADTETTPAATSEPAPLAADGDARIRDRSFAVPQTCLAPIVLVHPNGNTTRYIALTGIR